MCIGQDGSSDKRLWQHLRNWFEERCLCLWRDRGVVCRSQAHLQSNQYLCSGLLWGKKTPLGSPCMKQYPVKLIQKNIHAWGRWAGISCTLMKQSIWIFISFHFSNFLTPSFIRMSANVSQASLSIFMPPPCHLLIHPWIMHVFPAFFSKASSSLRGTPGSPYLSIDLLSRFQSPDPSPLPVPMETTSGLFVFLVGPLKYLKGSEHCRAGYCKPASARDHRESTCKTTSRRCLQQRNHYLTHRIWRKAHFLRFWKCNFEYESLSHALPRSLIFPVSLSLCAAGMSKNHLKNCNKILKHILFCQSLLWHPGSLKHIAAPQIEAGSSVTYFGS